MRLDFVSLWKGDMIQILYVSRECNQKWHNSVSISIERACLVMAKWRKYKQGVDSVSYNTSCHNISQSLEDARSVFSVFQSLWNSVGSREHCCLTTCQISQQYEHYNTAADPPAKFPKYTSIMTHNVVLSRLCEILQYDI